MKYPKPFTSVPLLNLVRNSVSPSQLLMFVCILSLLFVSMSFMRLKLGNASTYDNGIMSNEIARDADALDRNDIVANLQQEINALQQRLDTLQATNENQQFSNTNHDLAATRYETMAKNSSSKAFLNSMFDRSSGINSRVLKWNSVRFQPIPAAQLPSYKAEGANCERLFAGDRLEMLRAKQYKRQKLSADIVAAQAKNCQMFISTRRYVMTPATAEEADYPIAFSIIMHAEVEHFERLLRAIYRPQNHYCVHIDSKATASVRNAVTAIVSCFTNVFVTDRSIDVAWGKFTIIEPELVCMEELLRRYKRWLYFINLTGQEFPLKTNWDIVRILKTFNGSNNMEGTVRRRDDTRLTNRPPPPVPVTLTKGSVHIVATRGFVNYVLYNKDAIAFRDWVRDTYIPDETFFSSLNHSPQLGVPGAYLGKPETDTSKYMFIARFKNWGDGPFNWPCSGQRVRYVCIFGVGDLPLLASRPELFANKFYSDFEPATLDCMEELHFNRTRDEVTGTLRFDTTFYTGLSFINNHI